MVRNGSVIALALLCACKVQGSVSTSAGTAPPAEPPSSEAPPAEPKGDAPKRTTPASMTMQAKVDQFAVAELTADISDLPQSEKDALETLIDASKHLDPI